MQRARSKLLIHQSLIQMPASLSLTGGYHRPQALQLSPEQKFIASLKQLTKAQAGLALAQQTLMQKQGEIKKNDNPPVVVSFNIAFEGRQLEEATKQAEDEAKSYEQDIAILGQELEQNLSQVVLQRINNSQGYVTAKEADNSYYAFLKVNGKYVVVGAYNLQALETEVQKAQQND
jgi:predicted HicB family RNase H-like nuclease